MLDITSLGDSNQVLIPEMCATCENNGKGADKCKILKTNKCNYEPLQLTTFHEPMCNRCVFGMERKSSGNVTYNCSIGNFWATCNKFTDKKAPLPPADPEPEKRITHQIKILESFANAVHNGTKTFEVRKNDRGYQKGDLVKFTVLYDYDKCEMISHPLHDMTFEITYVLAGWGIEDGYVVFGIRPV